MLNFKYISYVSSNQYPKIFLNIWITQILLLKGKQSNIWEVLNTYIFNKDYNYKENDSKTDIPDYCIDIFNRNYYLLQRTLYWIQKEFNSMDSLYMTFGINPIGLFVDFYFALLIYGIVFLATGNKAGRSVVQYVAGAYQVFFYITLQ